MWFYKDVDWWSFMRSIYFWRDHPGISQEAWMGSSGPENEMRLYEGNRKQRDTLWAEEGMKIVQLSLLPFLATVKTWKHLPQKLAVYLHPT